uniref:Vitelline membrane outer layer 1 homolog n=1 Tax=Accipiter nisus TaxID=211598 RepID=A0A8B9NAG8_9AVES
MASSLCPWVALVVLVVLVQGGLGIAFTKVISVENGGPWGDWGDAEFCPEDTYATGFQLKVGPGWGDGGTGGGQHGGDGSLIWGSWTYPLSCGRSQRLVSFRLRVEAPRGLWDDTAANNLDITCSDGTVLEGQGGPAGVWGNWSASCPFGWGICGLQTRVEPPQRGGDDTGLNDVKFFCCT